MKKIFLVLFSLAITVASLEVFLRFFPPRIGFQKDRLWDHLNAGDAENAREFTTSYTYDPTIGYIRPAAIENLKKIEEGSGKKILFLGDSVTELGTFPEHIRSLISTSSAHHEITVINTGTVGYSTKMEKEFYEKYAESYKPDLIVLQMHPNDIGGTPVILPTKDSWIAFSPKFHTGFEQLPIIKDSHLYRFLMTLFLDFSSRQDTPEKYHQEMATSLAALQSNFQKRNTPFLIFIEPAYYPFDPGDYTYQNVKKIVVQSGLERNLVEMESVFDSQGKEKLMNGYDHPNYLGEDVIAKTLLPRVLQELHLPSENP